MIKGYKISNHVLNDREQRIIRIGTTIGFGKIVFSRKSEEGKVEAITDTGILFILDEEAKMIITCYPINHRRLFSFFYNKKVPAEIYKTVKENEKKYPEFFK